MSQERKCQLCQLPLARSAFWDNLSIHKICLDKVIEAVKIEDGKVEAKK